MAITYPNTTTTTPNKNTAVAAVSYKELDILSDYLSSFLNLSSPITDNTTKKRDGIIGIFCDRSVEMIVAILAIWKAGYGYLPIHTSFPKKRIEYIIEDAKV